MRIGKFAKSNNLTIDAVRHYMALGLIIPEMQGGQYHFDNRCQSDLEEVLNLKNMEFSLNEIKTILTYRRFGNLTVYEQNEQYQKLFENKLMSVEQKIKNLKEVRAQLEFEMRKLYKRNEEKREKRGIDLKNLNLFKCAECKGDLVLLKGNINENQIIDGILNCNCGVEYNIEDGILIVNDDSNQEGFVFNKKYIESYISSTNIEYLDTIYKNLALIYKKLDLDKFEEKTILELGSGVGFFLRNIYKDLPDNSVYIAVDHDLARHRFLKNILEHIDINKNIVFICSDFTRIPIKYKSVDILVDISGSSNYAFNNEPFLLNVIDHYVKELADLIGFYIIFKNFNVNSKIGTKYRKNFTVNHIKEKIKGLNFKSIYDRLSKPLAEGGKYEDYFIEGEEIYYYLYYGKR